MSFLTPIAFILTLLIPIIIALYLLKLKRTDRKVSSLYLWSQMTRDIEANSPWQKLSHNLLLILQLLFLIALIISLARPFIWKEGVVGESIIIILDISASMSANDIKPNRVEAAKAQARDIVDNMTGIGRVTVISAGRKATILISSSQDRNRIHQAINTIKPENGGSDMVIALNLASAVAARHPNTQIIVLSDGNVNLPQRFPVSGDLTYIQIGVQDQNQGISLLSLDPLTEQDGLTAFTQVMNYGNATANRRLVIYADGQPINAYDLELSPGQEVALLTGGIPGTSQVVDAKLLPNPMDADFLSIDDHAITVNRQNEDGLITLVSSGNLFLETALSLIPNYQTTVIKPSDLTEFPNSDLTIFDRFAPVTDTLPLGNLLFIAPIQSSPYFSMTGKLLTPVPFASLKDHPIVEHVNWDDVHILESAQIPLPEWASPIITNDSPMQEQDESFPLLFSGDVDNRRIAVITFDLYNSDLPLQVGFPILFSNLMRWLTPNLNNDIPIQTTPGEVITLRKPHGLSKDLESIRIIYPNGELTQFNATLGSILFSVPDQLGLYRIEWDNQTSTEFAVNSLTQQESIIAPVVLLNIANQKLSNEIVSHQRARQEWWRILAIIAFVLLLIEWIYFHRSSLAMVYRSLTLN